jgi:hypothetical protein
MLPRDLPGLLDAYRRLPRVDTPQRTVLVLPFSDGVPALVSLLDQSRRVDEIELYLAPDAPMPEWLPELSQEGSILQVHRSSHAVADSVERYRHHDMNLMVFDDRVVYRSRIVERLTNAYRAYPNTAVTATGYTVDRIDGTPRRPRGAGILRGVDALMRTGGYVFNVSWLGDTTYRADESDDARTSIALADRVVALPAWRGLSLPRAGRLATWWSELRPTRSAGDARIYQTPDARTWASAGYAASAALWKL